MAQVPLMPILVSGIISRLKDHMGLNQFPAHLSLRMEGYLKLHLLGKLRYNPLEKVLKRRKATMLSRLLLIIQMWMIPNQLLLILMRFLSMIMSFMNIKVLVFLAECSRNGQRVSGSMSML